MGAIKRKAEQPSVPRRKEPGALGDRLAKRPKPDAMAEQPAAKPKAEAPTSVFKDEEKAFPRGGASVLTPLEHKQIHIRANQDVLFEQAGIKRTGAADDDFSDMGSDDGGDVAQKPAKKKKKVFPKNSKQHEDADKEPAIRAEGLSYKVPLSHGEHVQAPLTSPATFAWHASSLCSNQCHPPGHRPRPPKQPRRLCPIDGHFRQAQREA